MLDETGVWPAVPVDVVERFRFVSSLPPTENHLVGRRHFPTQQYKAWLTRESVRLRKSLDEHRIATDVSSWWASYAFVFVTPKQRSDAATAYTKATHDLLSGSQIDRRTGRIVKPGAFWNDDKRVAEVHWRFQDAGVPEGFLTLILTLADPPRNWRPPQPRTRTVRARPR